jgi:DNA-binding NtrC family response regulator
MPKAMVLIVERDAALLASEVLLCKNQGYEVLSAEARSSAEQLLYAHFPDAVIIGHSLGRDDREVLVAKARLIRPAARILVLHASGSDLPVVAHSAIDSREGPESVLLALEKVLQPWPLKKQSSKANAATMPKQRFAR